MDLKRLRSRFADGGEAEVARAGLGLGRDALMHAAAVDRVELVELLLKAGADVHAADHLGFTAFLLACRNGNFALARRLLEAGSALMAVGPGKSTALHLAVEAQAVDLVEDLLARKKLKVDAKDGHGCTALDTIAARAHPALIEILLSHGAAPKGGGKQSPPLASAVGACCYLGAGEPAPTEPLHWKPPGGVGALVPVPEPRVLEAVRLLLQAGADPNQPGALGTPLMEAARQNHLEVARLLLAFGADPSLAVHGQTAADHAKLYGHAAMAKLLAAPRRQETTPTLKPREERWGPEVPMPDLAEPARRPEFQQVLKELEERCGSRPTELSPGAYLVHVQVKRRPGVDLEALQKELLQRGCFVFQPDSEVGKLVVLPVADRLTALAVMGTNGVNSGLGTGFLIEWLRHLETQQPFVLTTVGHDVLAGRFLTAVKKAVVKELVELGSDVENPLKGRSFYLWWD